jgi:hypothetical protein
VFEEWELATWIYLDSRSLDLSGKMMVLCVSRVAKGLMIDPALETWRKKFVERYGTIGMMLSIVFGESHPFAHLNIKP